MNGSLLDKQYLCVVKLLHPSLIWLHSAPRKFNKDRLCKSGIVLYFKLSSIWNEIIILSSKKVDDVVNRLG